MQNKTTHRMTTTATLQWLAAATKKQLNQAITSAERGQTSKALSELTQTIIFMDRFRALLKDQANHPTPRP